MTVFSVGRIEEITEEKVTIVGDAFVGMTLRNLFHKRPGLVLPLSEYSSQSIFKLKCRSFYANAGLCYM